MKTPTIIIAPDSFKNSIDAFSLSKILSEELKNNINCKLEILPVGDGGDGTATVVAKAINAEAINVKTYDPLKRRILSPIWFFKEKAIIEMSDVSGLKLLNINELNPLIASSGGLGILIKESIKSGKSHIILCIGGSATIDMGVGALMELGIKFLDSEGCEMKDVNIKSFNRVCNIDCSQTSFLKDIRIDIICDVENPLLGEKGAIRVYGPQKGVLEKDIDDLVDCHRHLSSVIEDVNGVGLANLKCGGAAGGISASFHALLGAHLYRGANYILNLLDFDEKIKDCDILITGEGRMDYQTQFGKAPYIVAKRARKYCSKVIAVNGQTDYLPSIFDKSFSLNDYSDTCHDSIANPKKYLKILTKDICNYIYSVI